jgi:hypothetical protein
MSRYQNSVIEACRFQFIILHLGVIFFLKKMKAIWKVEPHGPWPEAPKLLEHKIMFPSKEYFNGFMKLLFPYTKDNLLHLHVKVIKMLNSHGNQ